MKDFENSLILSRRLRVCMFPQENPSRRQFIPGKSPDRLNTRVDSSYKVSE